MSLYALLPAAGSGTRLKSEAPKQYTRIAGRPMLWHAVKALLAVPVEAVFVVLAPDDKRFAEGRAVSLSRRGASSRHIAQTLAQKGVAREHIQAGIAHAQEPHASPRAADLAAAAAYARRRRLGPYRSADERKDRRDRDLAALARKGFDFDVARRVIGALNIEELERTIARPDDD